MPPGRWTAIVQAAYSSNPLVVQAIIDQDAKKPLDPDQRAALELAKRIIEGEVTRWQAGLPLDDATPAPTGTPTPAASATGTPVPGTPTGTPIPEMPADIGPVYGPEVPDPNGRIQVQMPDGAIQDMTRIEYERFTPEERAQMVVIPQAPAYAPGLPQDIVNPPPGPGVGPGPQAPDASAPAAAAAAPAPDTTAADAAWDAAKPAVGASVTPAPAAPPASIAPPAPIKLPPNPPSNAPFQDETPDRRPPAQRNPSPPIKTTPPAAKPPAPAAKAPAPAAAAPAAKPVSPWESDESGATLPVTRLTRAVNQAGGRPTQRVTERAAREIGEVFRTGDQGGYRGDTGGWRTLAHAAANAWQEQYERDPNSLKQSERAAYERDKESLHRDILKADSPFRDYRESWIGATRAGQLVPQSQEFVGDLGRYGVPRPTGISNTTDRGGVPRETTPGQATRPGTPLPGSQPAPTVSPSAPPSQTATSPSSQIDLSQFGAVPESELRPQNRTGSALDLSEYGGVPESELRTPSSATRPGAPLEEPGGIPNIGPPERGPGILQEETPFSWRDRRAGDDRVALMRGGASSDMTFRGADEERRPMQGMPSWAATANPDAGRRVGEGRGRDVALRLWQNAYEIGGGDSTFADVIVGMANGEGGFSGRKDGRGATGLFQMDPAGGQQQLDRYLQEHGIQMSRDQAAGDVDIMSDFYVRKLHGAYRRAMEAGYTNPDDLVVQTAIYQWDPLNEPGAAHNAGIDQATHLQKHYVDGLHEFRQGVFRLLDPRLSEADQRSTVPEPGGMTSLSYGGPSPSNRLAMKQSDANNPWPEPGPRARDAARVRETSEIVDQGRARGLTEWEIAENLEMAGYGPAEDWYNALAEEAMHQEQQIYQQYPPDGSGPGAQLDTEPPPGEERYYGPNIQVETPRGYEDSEDGLYDEGGYPLFKTYDDSGDYATYDQSFYEDEPTYAEYEDEGEGDYEVAEYEPEYSSDYEYEYA